MPDEQLVQLGQFTVPSGMLYVTDLRAGPPRPDEILTFSLSVPVAKRSKWVAFLLTEDDRPLSFHVGQRDKIAQGGDLETLGSIGTDSAMVGMFDVDRYRKLYKQHDEDLEGYFGDKEAGVDKHGAFAANGIGAGFFPVGVSRDDQGDIVQVVILFDSDDQPDIKAPSVR